MKVPYKGFIKATAPYGSISQYFGENPELYSQICYGDGVNKKCLAGHNGIDFVAPWYTPLLAVESGRIFDTKISPTGYGKHTRIMTQKGVEWTYGHLADISVIDGQWVDDGDLIGYMGNTGFVVSAHDGNGYWKSGSNKWAGTHLHLGKRIWRFGQVENYDNGYFGSVDYIDELPDGDITPPTFKFNRNLYFGTTGNDVVELQKRFKEEGLFNHEFYPRFGRLTLASAIAYQKKHNISPPFGFVGPITRGFLNSIK